MAFNPATPAMFGVASLPVLLFSPADGVADEEEELDEELFDPKDVILPQRLEKDMEEEGEEDAAALDAVTGDEGGEDDEEELLFCSPAEDDAVPSPRLKPPPKFTAAAAASSSLNVLSSFFSDAAMAPNTASISVIEAERASSCICTAPAKR